MRFHAMKLINGDFDLRSVRLMAPAVNLNGRLGLAGTLDGPLKDVDYQGRVEHRDDGRPLTALTGRVKLDTRGALLGLDATLRLDTLSFEGLRGSFPTLPMKGSVRGTARLVGFLDSLSVDASVAGAIGRYQIRGVAI